MGKSEPDRENVESIYDDDIDRAVYGMCGFIELLRTEPRITGIILPNHTIKNWQEQLDYLRTLDGSDPIKARYNHEAVKKLADFFRLKY